MDDTPKLPMPKTSPGELFTKRLNELAEYATAASKALLGQGTAKWYRPGDYTAALTDLDAIHAPFNRDKQADEFRATVTKPDDPGTVGDLAMVQLQGDMLACMERAFRARHHTAVRSRIQPASRLKGHGAPTGVIPLGLLGYINDIDRFNKSEDP